MPPGRRKRHAPNRGFGRRPWRLAATAPAGNAEPNDAGPVVLITVDNLGVPGRLRDEVAAALAQRRGIASGRLSICSSHTHSGPALDGVARLVLGDDLPTAQRDHISDYTAKLKAWLIDVAEKALDARQPGRVAWSEGTLPFGANRRLVENGRWVGFGVDRSGPVDPAMPLLRVTAADGTLRAVVVNYACHATTLGPDFNQIGGDWVGYAQEYIERDQPGAGAGHDRLCGGYQSGAARQAGTGGAAWADGGRRSQAPARRPRRPAAGPGPLGCRHRGFCLSTGCPRARIGSSGPRCRERLPSTPGPN